MRFRFLPALLLALAIGGASTSAFADDVQVTPEAREKFKAGVALLQDPDGARYEEAYFAFKAAYAISPSPNILGNLGLCAMKLERYGEAIEVYSSYVTKGTGLGDEEKKQIETDLSTMKSTLATIELKVDPPTATIVDERIPTSGNPVRNRYGQAGPNGLKLGVRAGTHRFHVTMDGYAEQVVEIDLTAGATESRTVKLEKPTTTAGGPAPGPGPGPGPDPSKPVELERPVPAYVWVTLAATGALAIGTGVTGGLAMANKSDFDDANDGSDPAAAQDLADKGTTLNIVTDVLLGTTIAAAGVTAVLFFTRPEVPKDTARVMVLPTVAGRGDGAGVTVLGTF